MALFDSVIEEAKAKFGLETEKARSLLTALLGLIADPQGGYGAFEERFRKVGLRDTLNSWVTSGDNTPISNEQLESALGEDTIATIASDAGVDRPTATSALSMMLPHVVDQLTPDGEIPDDNTLRSRTGGFSSGVGAAGALASGAPDRVDPSAYETGRDIGRAGTPVADADLGPELVSSDDDRRTVMDWLLPLILFGLLVVLGFWFCGRSEVPPTPPPANVNTNANVAPARTSANTSANTVVVNANTAP